MGFNYSKKVKAESPIRAHLGLKRYRLCGLSEAKVAILLRMTVITDKRIWNSIFDYIN